MDGFELGREIGALGAQMAALEARVTALERGASAPSAWSTVLAEAGGRILQAGAIVALVAGLSAAGLLEGSAPLLRWLGVLP